jgi:hypothetical protein
MTSLIFALGPQEKLFCQTIFFGNLFFWRSYNLGESDGTILVIRKHIVTTEVLFYMLSKGGNTTLVKKTATTLDQPRPWARVLNYSIRDYLILSYHLTFIIELVEKVLSSMVPELSNFSLRIFHPH